MTAIQFSLLLPVYAGDRAAWLEHSLASAFEGQTLPPAQVVIAQDGPVGPKLTTVLQRWKNRPETTLVTLPTNRGIAAALNAGLRACRHPNVARLDADDICLPGRFEAQIPLLTQGFDIVGGAIDEFLTVPGDSKVTRHYPTGQADIERFARLHNPFPHPAVAFNADLVRQVGGYRQLDRLEDYLLWAKCLMAGAKVTNLDQSLVAYRVSPAAYKRRGGAKLLVSEVKLQRTLRAIGFTRRTEEVRNMVLRCGFELAPPSLRQLPLRAVLSGSTQEPK